jgi:acetyl-CoA acetyltransferase
LKKSFHAGETLGVTETSAAAGIRRSRLWQTKPIFDRKDGTVTVGNACQITDSAVSMLVTDGETARRSGTKSSATSAATRVGLEPAGWV